MTCSPARRPGGPTGRSATRPCWPTRRGCAASCSRGTGTTSRGFTEAGEFHCGLVLCGYDPDADHGAGLIEAMIEGQPEGAPWLVKVFRGMRIDQPRGGLAPDPQG